MHYFWNLTTCSHAWLPSPPAAIRNHQSLDKDTYIYISNLFIYSSDSSQKYFLKKGSVIEIDYLFFPIASDCNNGKYQRLNCSPTKYHTSPYALKLNPQQTIKPIEIFPNIQFYSNKLVIYQFNIIKQLISALLSNLIVV